MVDYIYRKKVKIFDLISNFGRGSPRIKQPNVLYLPTRVLLIYNYVEAKLHYFVSLVVDDRALINQLSL